VKENSFKQALSKIPWVKKIYFFLRSLIIQINPRPKIKRIYYSLWNSKFEKIFKKYDLLEQYKIIKKMRVDQQSSI